VQRGRDVGTGEEGDAETGEAGGEVRGLDGGEGGVKGLDVCTLVMYCKPCKTESVLTMGGAVCKDVCALTMGREVCEGFGNVASATVQELPLSSQVWTACVGQDASVVSQTMMVWACWVELGGAVVLAALQASDLRPFAFLAFL
jgi:hypothetical protein